MQATGATFRSWRDVPHRARPEDPDPFDDTGRHGPKIVQLLLDTIAAGPAALYAQEVTEALDAHRSDALVSSMLMLGGLAAAEARGIPAVVLVPNCYLIPTPGMPPFGMSWPPARGAFGRARVAAMNNLGIRLWDRGLPRLNALRRDLGLEPLRHLFDQHRSAEHVLVLTSQAFDFSAELPRNVRYAGPQLDDPHWAGEAGSAPADVTSDDLVQEYPGGADPLVLVSMSTTDMGQVELLRRVVAALDRLQVRGLVTTGPGVDPDQVPATRTVAVLRAAPHARIMSDAAAVVSHGGHGTVIKALAAGLPQLVVPLGRDQPNNAARITHRGAGLQLRRTSTTGAIAQAVERILQDRGFTHRAAELGATVRADAERTTVLEHLERI
ncbi:glycosyltransferase [Actinomycetospora sp.]|uniref:glycosyltransferase n=1 Tax=Actinomycetospora sp. TaxID=1872135 RepID=UPI002F406405